MDAGQLQHTTFLGLNHGPGCWAKAAADQAKQDTGLHGHI